MSFVCPKPKYFHLDIMADRYRCSCAYHWSAGADHSAAHDPSSWETTPVGVF